MIETPLKSASPVWVSLFAAAALTCFSLSGHAAGLTAAADINHPYHMGDLKKGCAGGPRDACGVIKLN